MASTDSITSNDTDYEHVYTLLEEVFESSITEADSSELVSILGDLYDSFAGQGFEDSFEKILLYILSESKRSNDVVKLLRFLSECSVFLDNKYKTAVTKAKTVEDIDDIVHPLLKHLFNTLIKWSQSSSYVIRFRSCQTLFMILTNIQEYGMGELDAETYEAMAKLIESRRLDVSSNVRTHAVLLAKFFQDPSVVNDPVIAGLCYQMQHDPCPRVRQNIVSIIAACEETIIPIAKRFLYDKNASVRNAALLHICKRIGPRSFTPYQRILILQQCFSDSSDLIRRNAEQKLIPVWFRAYGDKLCTFFKHLRIGSESLDNLPFVKELTKVLSKCVKISQIVEEIELDLTSSLPKLPLSGEKVFLWRHFFMYSTRDERLSKFFPSLDRLIPFILMCFDDSSSEEVETCVFTELVLFLMDIMGTLGIQNCGDVFPMALQLMRHPFVPHQLMPYLVVLYSKYSPKEKELVHKDILEVIEDLLKLMQYTAGQEINILLKCFAIATQILMDSSSLTPTLKNIKDNLVIHHLSSEDPTIKIQAILCLALYCLIDLMEAKLSWPLFENALHLDSSPLRYTLLEGAFDILKCHGLKIFADIANDGKDTFEETIKTMLTCIEDGERELKIVSRGILKLYMDHHTVSPAILAHLVVLFFHPDDYASTQHDLEEFFPIYGETMEGSDCLVKTFLAVVNILFDANKTNYLYKISIKTVANQLLEFSKTFESQKRNNEEKFQDLLVVKLTKKFLKKPWRLTASDLYTICNQIMPRKFETLFKLKENIMQIIQNLQSSTFQQKNPYSKKNVKNFTIYLKKVQVAMNAAPIIENPPGTPTQSPTHKRLHFSSASSLSSKDNTPPGIIISAYSSPVVRRSSISEVIIPISPVLHKAKTPGSKEKGNLIGEISTPCAISTPCKTPGAATDSNATPSGRNPSSRLSRKAKTPAGVPPKNMTVCEEIDTFKTPGPRKARKRHLDVSLMKTA